jgi:hypothetical protein
VTRLIAPAALVLWCAAVISAAHPAAAPFGRSAPWRTANAYADGAPPGFSGGFGEQSCHACHFQADVNTKPGQLTLDGVPARFVGGTSYPLTIALERPDMKSGGFVLTARFEDGGAQAGSLAGGPAERERVKVETQADVQYASQRRMGTALASVGTARWTVVWTAPATRGVVQFHVAANAADNDESASGDYVFTLVGESAPASQ